QRDRAADFLYYYFRRAAGVPPCGKRTAGGIQNSSRHVHRNAVGCSILLAAVEHHEPRCLDYSDRRGNRSSRLYRVQGRGPAEECVKNLGASILRDDRPQGHGLVEEPKSDLHRHGACGYSFDKSQHSYSGRRSAVWVTPDEWEPTAGLSSTDILDRRSKMEPKMQVLGIQPQFAAQPERLQDTSTTRRWNFAKKVGFRFVFTYLVLFILTSQEVQSIPRVASIIARYNRLWRFIVPWVGKHILRLNYDMSLGPSGSGDRTYDWVLALCYMALAVAVTALWSLADRKRSGYPRLHQWLRLAVR